MCTQLAELCNFICETYDEVTPGAVGGGICQRVRLYIEDGSSPARWVQLPRAVYETIVSRFVLHDLKQLHRVFFIIASTHHLHYHTKVDLICYL